MSELFSRYCDGMDRTEDYVQLVRRRFANHVEPHIGKLSVLSVTKSDIRHVMESIETESVRYVVFAGLRPFFKWCIEKEIIATNPTEGMRQPNTSERDRVLDDTELKLIWLATDKLKYPWGAWLKMLWLTSQRRDAVAGMCWRELNFDTGLWTIPKGRMKKSRKDHVVPLSSQAVAVLQGIERQCDYVFHTNFTTPISGYSKAKSMLDGLLPADMAHWTVHDIRRSGATVLQREPYSHAPWAIDALQARQVENRVRRVYQRHLYDQEKVAMVRDLGEHIEGLCRGSD
jgi:integrase